MLCNIYDRCIVAISDSDGHLGLGIECSRDVTTAIRGATVYAKLAVIPVRRGYWGKHVGEPHTVPREVRDPYLFERETTDRLSCPRYEHGLFR